MKDRLYDLSTAGVALDAAVFAVHAAESCGADGCDAYVRTASEIDLEVRRGEAENLQEAITRGLGLRVLVEGRVALVHTTDLSPRALTALAAKAIEIARNLPPSAEPLELAPVTPVLPHDHQDPSLRDQPVSQTVEWLAEVERALLGVPGIAEATAVKWSQSDRVIAFANSRGLALQTADCGITIEAEAMAHRDGQTSTGACYVEVPSRRRLPDPSWIGTTAAERAMMVAGARGIPSCKVPVIFPPWMGWTVIVWLAQALRGDHVASGRSYLAGRIGTAVASPLVTISDLPHDLRGPEHRPFDAEGTPTSDRVLIEGGILSSYLTDRRSARKLGVEPGGHAVRGSYTQAPEVGGSNFLMAPGAHDADAIIASTPRGLLVTNLSGWWLNMSPATDVFSAAAMGIWIEGGERAYPVRGITIAGTIREILAAVDMVGSDLRVVGRITTPTFRVAEMTVSGSEL